MVNVQVPTGTGRNACCSVPSVAVQNDSLGQFVYRFARRRKRQRLRAKRQRVDVGVARERPRAARARTLGSPKAIELRRPARSSSTRASWCMRRARPARDGSPASHSDCRTASGALAMDIFVKRPALSLVISIVIVLVGIFAAQQHSDAAVPEDRKQLAAVITTAYFGASLEVVQGFITEPIEEVAMTIPGVDYVDTLDDRRIEHGHGLARPERRQHACARGAHHAPRADPFRAARRRGGSRRGDRARRSFERAVLPRRAEARTGRAWS